MSVVPPRGSNIKPPLTAEALFRMAEKSKSQLDAWLEQPEYHERLAVGKQTSRSSEAYRGFLEGCQ